MSGDKQLIEAYNNKRDLYATIAAKIYRNSYWDNMETHEDGTPNPEGKKRRGATKTIVLAILYGMGADSLSVSLKCTKEEAQKLIDDFFAGYPTVHKFIEENNAFARKNGYVDGIMGRRRRLPDILLPRYSIRRNGASELFNPILGTDKISEKREDSVVKKYKDKVDKAKGWREVKEIQEEAKKDGVVISSNGGFISRAERQCINSKIQGGAATITKLAMLNIDKDDELNRLGFRTLICVHD